MDDLAKARAEKVRADDLAAIDGKVDAAVQVMLAQKADPLLISAVDTVMRKWKVWIIQNRPLTVDKRAVNSYMDMGTSIVAALVDEFVISVAGKSDPQFQLQLTHGILLKASQIITESIKEESGKGKRG